MNRACLVGLLLLITGIGFGMNIASDRPLFSNPLAEDDVRERARQKADALDRRSKELLLDPSRQE